MLFQSDTSPSGPHLPRCDPASIFSLPCVFWVQGRCKFGESCKFSHGEMPPGANRSASMHRRESLREAAKAEKAEENRKRKEAAALVAERAKEEHAKRLVQEKEAREAREAKARQLQLELKARRKREALVTEQDIVLGSSLITYGAGLDVRDVTPGFDLRQVTIKGLPPDAREEEIVHMFTQQGLERTSFFIVCLKSTDNGLCQEAAVLMSAEEGVAIAIGLQLIEFRQHFLMFEVGEKAGGSSMRCNSDFLTVYQSPSPDALKYKINIPQQQYEAQKRQWDSLSEITPGNDAHVETKIDDGTVFIYVRGQNKRAVGSLKVRVEHMVAGKRLDPNFWHPSFSSRSQRRFFNRIYQTVGVYVRVNLKTRSLRVYSGSDALVEVACMMIKEEVDRLAKLETTELLNPASISFFIRGGLAQLKELLGEENASLDFGLEGLHITIKGGEEGRRQLDRLIAESLTSEFMDQILPGDTERETCPICTDEISCPEQLGCGHTYCSQCLQHYLESAPSSKIFPLVCIGDEGACKVPISIPEIRRFLQPQVFQALVEAAFRSYLDQHTQELKFCTTPDCQQIYRHSPTGNGTRTLQCPSCFSTICSTCDEEAHEGMTCEERRVQKDPAEQDRLFYQWTAENGGKRCPQCRCVIEKISGCNHITCRCGAEFCWHCGFRGRDIYQHMRNVHGGIHTATPAWTITDAHTAYAGQGTVAVVRYEYNATEDIEMNLAEGELIADIEEIEEGWWMGVGPGGKTGLFPSNYVEVVHQPEAHEEEPAEVDTAPPPPPPPLPPAFDVGIYATALYEYEAAEDNEIFFTEGDIITDIEPASEDWWQGMNSHGNVGLFPANYIEMQAQEEAPRQAPLPQPPLRQFPPPPRLRNTFAETVHDAAHGAAVPVIQNYDNVESCCIVI